MILLHVLLILASIASIGVVVSVFSNNDKATVGFLVAAIFALIGVAIVA